MRIGMLSVLSLGALVFAAGCADPKVDTPDPHDAGSSDPHAHAHPTEGPHHGTLVELGEEQYHAEVVHDDASVTVYILDSSAKKSVAIAAKEVTINLLHDGTPEQFALAAKALDGEAEGMSSCFTLEDAELVAHIDDEASAPKLNLTIDGISFRGAIKHDHDHGHDDHGHDDHGHDDHGHGDHGHGDDDHGHEH